MTKRIFYFLAALLMGSVLGWLTLRPGPVAVTDEMRYRVWQQPDLKERCASVVAPRPPPRLSKALHLPSVVDEYLGKNEVLRQKMLASGYLTNVHIPVIDSAIPRKGAYQVVMACRQAGI